MSDATEPRATMPFPAEGTAPALPAFVDPLAGDWSEGLRGPVRALGIAEPRLLLRDGLPQPEAPRQVPLPPVAPVAEVAEASSEPPSVIVTFTDPPEEAPEAAPVIAPPAPPPPLSPPQVPTAFHAQATPAPPALAFLPDVTPASPAPAFLPDVTPASPAPAFLPDVTPASAAPAFLPDVTKATPAPAFRADPAPTTAPEAPAAPPLEDSIVELGADDAAEAIAFDPPASDPWTADAAARAGDSAAWASALSATPAADAPSAWSDPVESPPPPAVAAEPAWKDAPVPVAIPAVAAVSAWDQVTAVSPAVAWQMPPAQAEAAPQPAVDEVWSSPPPASEPVAEWKADAPPGDWQEVKRTAPPASLPHAADWDTLSRGPDWSSTSPAEAAPAEGDWGSAPPPPAASAWEAPVAAVEPSAWEAPAPVAPEIAWSAPAPVAPETAWSAPAVPPAPAWNAMPVGASAMEQLESDPPEIVPVPGAAQELFGSVPVGASLSAEEGEQLEDLGQPEELASPEQFLKPVELSDEDADLLVPVEEATPTPPRPQPLATMQPVGVGALFVPGEHRVAVHTRGGRTRRGVINDVDLGKSQFTLVPQGGGEGEPVYHAEVKAIFFMLSPGEKPQPPTGRKVRVTFADGRTVEGRRDGAEGKHGFFLVPVDALRTNTRLIYIAREATTDIKDG